MTGMIVFANFSGLGYETKRICDLLKPDRLLIVNSTTFSKNKQLQIGWYNGYTATTTAHGAPSTTELKRFLTGLKKVWLCETPLNNTFWQLVDQMGIQTYLTVHYEFLDHLVYPSMPLPTKFVLPSVWMMSDMIRRFGSERIVYLPPPLDPATFANARATNLARKGKRKFLHIMGTVAAEDRNGTLDVLASLKYTDEDFNLTITHLHKLEPEYITNDSRVSYLHAPTHTDMYTGYDALLLPRRYAGLSLPVNEALSAGLPALMTDCAPNNEWLPSDWLISASKTGMLQTRTLIPIYSVDQIALARKIEQFVHNDIQPHKYQAIDLSISEFSPDSLRERYNALWLH